MKFMLKLRWLEYIWHVVALTLIAGAFVPLWRDRIGFDLGEGDPLQRMVLLIAYTGLVFLLWHLRTVFRVASQHWLIWLIIGLAFFSALWSQDPALTIRRSVTLLLATLYGLLLAVRFSPTTVLRLIGAALTIIVIASVISISIGAEWAVMERLHPGAWQGVMVHKNALGRICVLALIVTWSLTQITAGRERLFWIGVAGGAVCLIVGSNSATALVVVVVLIMVWLAIKIMQGLTDWAKLRVMLLSAAFVLTLGVLGLVWIEDIANRLGRNLDLTGRVPLWLALWPIIWQQPLLGYGFGAFWLDVGRETTVDIVLMRTRFTWATHAHNGFLDVWLELGLVGLFLVCFILFWLLRRTWKVFWQSNVHPVLLFGFLFTIYTILYNFTEVTLVESGLSKALFTIIFSYVYFMTSKIFEEQ